MTAKLRSLGRGVVSAGVGRDDRGGLGGLARVGQRTRPQPPHPSRRRMTKVISSEVGHDAAAILAALSGPDAAGLMSNQLILLLSGLSRTVGRRFTCDRRPS